MSSNVAFFSIYAVSFSLEIDEINLKAFVVSTSQIANHEALSGKFPEGRRSGQVKVTKEAANSQVG